MKRSSYALAVLLFASSLAYGHAQLTASMPADEAALAAAPQELMLHFSEAVRLTAVSVTRSGSGKQDLTVPAQRAKDFIVAAPGLAEGAYEVSWRALAGDSHVMTGTFSFSVGGAARADHAGHSAAPAGERHEASHRH